jgi:hypothetical protein
LLHEYVGISTTRVFERLCRDVVLVSFGGGGWGAVMLDEPGGVITSTVKLRVFQVHETRVYV